jgi:hypothetical protein
MHVTDSTQLIRNFLNVDCRLLTKKCCFVLPKLFCSCEKYGGLLLQKRDSAQKRFKSSHRSQPNLVYFVRVSRPRETGCAHITDNRFYVAGYPFLDRVDRFICQLVLGVFSGLLN